MSTLDRFSLKDKTVIVTGASQGIGESIAMGMAEAGANVVLAARSVDKLERSPQKSKPLAPDASRSKPMSRNADDIEAMVQATVDEYGTVDCLVNNAGINLVKPALDITEEEWDAVIDTNLKAYFMCSQAAGRVMMKNGGGSIINNASVFGLRGFQSVCLYFKQGWRCTADPRPGGRMGQAGYTRKLRCTGLYPDRNDKRDIEANPAILKFNLRKIPDESWMVTPGKFPTSWFSPLPMRQVI